MQQTMSELPDPSSRVLWDVVEEHLDEADFLCGQWERALDQAANLRDVGKVEQRLLAHIDGLLVNGPEVVPRLLEPALLGDEEVSASRATAASLALLGHGRQDMVVRALLGECAGASAGAERALGLAGAPALDAWLYDVLARDMRSARRAPLLRVAAARGLSLNTLLGPLQSDDLSELAAAAHCARWADPGRHLPVLLHLLDHEDAAVADAALVSGLVLGAPQALERCVSRALDTQRVDPNALLLTALLGRPSQQAALRGLLAHATHRKAVLAVLGYTGDVSFVPTLVAELRNEDVRIRKIAAEGIGVLTGIDTADDAFVLEERDEGDDELPPLEEDLARELVPTAVDMLPLPNVDAIEAWWADHAGTFPPRGRVLGGAPWTRERVWTMLDEAPARRRHPLALWLLVRSRGRARVDTRGLTEGQRAQTMSARGVPLDGLGRDEGAV